MLSKLLFAHLGLKSGFSTHMAEAKSYPNNAQALKLGFRARRRFVTLHAESTENSLGMFKKTLYTLDFGVFTRLGRRSPFKI